MGYRTASAQKHAPRDQDTPRLPSAIELDRVGHIYVAAHGRSVPALGGVTTSIAPGEFVSILGPSGCGKSTLLNIVAGLITPTSGGVRIDGLTPRQKREHHDMAVVFQEPALLPWRNAVQNVALPLELTHSRSAGAAVIRSLLQRMGLRGFEEHFPREMSGGMNSRVAVARAVVTRPNVLLMDEPFGSLDELTAEDLSFAIMPLLCEFSPTVVMVTHSIYQAVLLSDRVIVLSARPAHVRASVAIPLARPRQSGMLENSEYLELTVKIRRLLSEPKTCDARTH